MKKLVAQKNRERERLGGKLNPLEEAFLMEDVNKAKAEQEAKQSPEEAAAIAAGIAAAKAASPEATLAALYDKPVPVPAPILAHMYGPNATSGRMEKNVLESLIGGRIELRFSRLLTGEKYASLTPKERKILPNEHARDWQQVIVGADVYWSQELYRAIGKPAAMEIMGEIEWLIEQNEHHHQYVPALARKARWIVGMIAAVMLMAIIGLCSLTRKKKKPSASDDSSSKKQQ